MTKFKLFIQHVIPHFLLTQLMGYLASSKNRLLKNVFIKIFSKCYDINMCEAVEENALAYPTFNDFFIRRLKEGARPIGEGVVSPADGGLSQSGRIRGGELIQAKGQKFTLNDFLVGDKQLVDCYQQGSFATIYLAPHNYHRVHMPLTGTLKKMIYVPGKLFSVSPLTAQNIPNLFARNERVIAHFDTEQGPMAVVMVGAMIVGSISTVWAGQITPPRRGRVNSIDYDAPITLKKGDELGYFSLGSTVVMLFGQSVDWCGDLATVQVGQALI